MELQYATSTCVETWRASKTHTPWVRIRLVDLGYYAQWQQFYVCLRCGVLLEYDE